VEMPRRALGQLECWLCLGMVLATLSGGAGDAAEALHARAGIRAQEAGGHIRALADDAFEGREAGRRGGQAAGRYVANALAPLELEPAGDEGSLFQTFASRQGTLRNVLALLPGRDPAVRNEVVVVGAHYDHVGYGNARNSFGPFGFVHNGADDNASGVAGLIEIAEALVGLPQPPRRSVLLAFWDGEEQGLLGSKQFLKDPPTALEYRRIVFAINLDMIGRLRDNTLSVYGTRSAVGLEEMVIRLNGPQAQTPLQLVFNWKVEPDSDHYTFLQAGIPTLMFHTGLHDDYHRPSDDAHRVNLSGLEPVARLTFDTVLQVADAEEACPAFRPACRAESNATKSQLQARAVLPADSPGRWGIGIRVDLANPRAPLVVAIRPGSPADRGGLKRNDRILEIAGVPISDQNDLMRKLAAVEPATSVEVLVARRGRLFVLVWTDRHQPT